MSFDSYIARVQPAQTTRNMLIMQQQFLLQVQQLTQAIAENHRTGEDNETLALNSRLDGLSELLQSRELEKLNQNIMQLNQELQSLNLAGGRFTEMKPVSVFDVKPTNRNSIRWIVRLFREAMRQEATIKTAEETNEKVARLAKDTNTKVPDQPVKPLKKNTPEPAKEIKLPELGFKDPLSLNDWKQGPFAEQIVMIEGFKDMLSKYTPGFVKKFLNHKFTIGYDAEVDEDTLPKSVTSKQKEVEDEEEKEEQIPEKEAENTSELEEVKSLVLKVEISNYQQVADAIKDAIGEGESEDKNDEIKQLLLQANQQLSAMGRVLLFQIAVQLRQLSEIAPDLLPAPQGSKWEKDENSEEEYHQPLLLSQAPVEETTPLAEVPAEPSTDGVLPMVETTPLAEVPAEPSTDGVVPITEISNEADDVVDVLPVEPSTDGVVPITEISNEADDVVDVDYEEVEATPLADVNGDDTTEAVEELNESVEASAQADAEQAEAAEEQQEEIDKENDEAQAEQHEELIDEVKKSRKASFSIMDLLNNDLFSYAALGTIIAAAFASPEARSFMAALAEAIWDWFKPVFDKLLKWLDTQLGGEHYTDANTGENVDIPFWEKSKFINWIIPGSAGAELDYKNKFSWNENAITGIHDYQNPGAQLAGWYGKYQNIPAPTTGVVPTNKTLRRNKEGNYYYSDRQIEHSNDWSDSEVGLGIIEDIAAPLISQGIDKTTAIKYATDEALTGAKMEKTIMWYTDLFSGIDPSSGDHVGRFAKPRKGGLYNPRKGTILYPQDSGPDGQYLRFEKEAVLKLYDLFEQQMKAGYGDQWQKEVEAAIEDDAKSVRKFAYSNTMLSYRDRREMFQPVHDERTGRLNIMYMPGKWDQALYDQVGTSLAPAYTKAFVNQDVSHLSWQDRHKWMMGVGQGVKTPDEGKHLYVGDTAPTTFTDLGAGSGNITENGKGVSHGSLGKGLDATKLQTYSKGKFVRTSEENPNNRRKIHDALIRAGYSESAAAGILANIHRESRFNPKAANSNSSARGIMQWMAGTRRSMEQQGVKDFTKEKNWDTLEVQIPYMLKYLEKTGMTPKLLNGMNPETAASKVLTGAEAGTYSTIQKGFDSEEFKVGKQFWAAPEFTAKNARWYYNQYSTTAQATVPASLESNATEVLLAEAETPQVANEETPAQEVQVPTAVAQASQSPTTEQADVKFNQLSLASVDPNLEKRGAVQTGTEVGTRESESHNYLTAQNSVTYVQVNDLINLG